jgi:hypothetical protein
LEKLIEAWGKLIHEFQTSAASANVTKSYDGNDFNKSWEHLSGIQK